MDKSYGELRPRGAGADPARSGEIIILLVDKRAWSREALGRALEAACPDFRVHCFEDASDLGQALPALRQTVILLNLTGIALASCGVTTAVATARSRLPGVPVVAIADSTDADDILNAVEQGLSGYMPNSLELQLVVEGLKFVTAGGTFVPAEPLLASLDAAPRCSSSLPEVDKAAVAEPVNGRGPTFAVTPRESAVLGGLRQGLSNTDSAGTRLMRADDKGPRSSYHEEARCNESYPSGAAVRASEVPHRSHMIVSLLRGERRDGRDAVHLSIHKV